MIGVLKIKHWALRKQGQQFIFINDETIKRISDGHEFKLGYQKLFNDFENIKDIVIYKFYDDNIHLDTLIFYEGTEYSEYKVKVNDITIINLNGEYVISKLVGIQKNVD